jgi:hypothetical protein
MNNTGRNPLVAAALAVGASAALALAQPTAPPPPPPPPPPSPPSVKPFQQDIPSAAYKLDMLPIPADVATGIKPFWIAKTEVTWEAFDVYIYKLD